jgi:hypothetical protein
MVPIIPGSPAGQLYYDPTLGRGDASLLAQTGTANVAHPLRPLQRTDSVPAQLTPREAVLNRNAAELIGRHRIRHANAIGNHLAAAGIDLSSINQNAQPLAPLQQQGAMMPPPPGIAPGAGGAGYQTGISDVPYTPISDPNNPGLNINTPGQPGYVPTSPSATPPTSGAFLGSRTQLANELKDPRVQAQFYNLVHNEVGGQGPQAQQAFIETLFNRSATRGKTLTETINDKNYYPESSYKPVTIYPDQQAHYDRLVGSVTQGSNISGGATGNASGSVGFGGGPTTFSAGGENFGIDKPDLN